METKTMTAITFGKTAVQAPAAATAATGPKRPNIFRLLFEAFIEARQLQAEMEIRRHLGHRLTDDGSLASVSYKGRE
jgi:hypothetical protein